MRAIQTVARAGVLCLVLCLAAAGAPARANETANETPNDVARFLAGLPPAAESPLAPLTEQAAWKQHAQALDAAYARLEHDRLAKVRAWSAGNLTKPQQTVLYMFSGPDFLYMDAFFPDRTTYVMTGLEPIGPIPSITPGLSRNYAGALAGLRSSVGTALNISFFITRNMERTLSGYGRSFRGVLPVLYLFMARSGKTLHDVTLIAIDNNGELVAADTKGATPGVKITFSGKEGRMQTLYYFRSDLSNAGTRRSGLLQFCEKLGVAEVFIKSASYLLHSANFTTVRSFLLDRAATVVQDDSGIPVRFFSAKEWSLHPFGRYLGPIPVFAGQYQRALSELFRKSSPPRLEFGVGYRWRPQESNLLLAERTAPAAAAQPSESRAPQQAPKAPQAASPKPPGASQAAPKQEETPASPK